MDSSSIETPLLEGMAVRLMELAVVSEAVYIAETESEQKPETKILARTGIIHARNNLFLYMSIDKAHLFMLLYDLVLILLNHAYAKSARVF